MIPMFGHRGRGSVKSGVITAISMPFLVLILVAALAFPAMAQGKGLGTGKGKGLGTGKGVATGKGLTTGQGVAIGKGLATGRGSADAAVRILDAVGAATGTVGTGGGLPPGLAKGHAVPPGLAKRGGNLPPGLRRR